MITFRPKSVNILGKVYGVVYVDNPAGVDSQGRRSLWGQIDYWTRTIRIYDKGRGVDDRLEAIIHEVLHALDNHFKLDLDDGTDDHKKLDMLSVALADMLLRNGWIIGAGKENAERRRKEDKKKTNANRQPR